MLDLQDLLHAGLKSYLIAAYSCTKKRMQQDPLSMRARGTQLVNAPALK